MGKTALQSVIASATQGLGRRWLPLSKRLPPTLSATVLLVGVDPGMSLIDLRVDHDPAPVAKLRTLWEEYRGWVRDFRLRAIDPDQAAGHADATDGEGVI